jgi:hypothetical protein
MHIIPITKYMSKSHFYSIIKIFRARLKQLDSFNMYMCHLFNKQQTAIRLSKSDDCD